MTPLQSVVKPEVHEVVMDELHGIVLILPYEAPHVFAISSTALKNGKSSFMMSGMQKQPDAAQSSFDQSVCTLYCKYQRTPSESRI